MQTLEANIMILPPTGGTATFVGTIPDPVSTDPTDKSLAPYHLLGRQAVYTLNAQNQIANSLLQLPAATQKQAVLTITVLFADPKFEVSTGAFFSWMPNRTFANYTQVSVISGVPTPGNVIINETTSTPPEIIPYAAANYRLGSDFRSFGGRRSAVYGTLAVGFNPYNTTVEYAAGFSFSWRFLMLSPLFHIGQSIHLTQGEAPNQVWCSYSAAADTTTPPLPMCGITTGSLDDYFLARCSGLRNRDSCADNVQCDQSLVGGLYPSIDHGRRDKKYLPERRG
jgi:hypothetical protein